MDDLRNAHTLTFTKIFCACQFAANTFAIRLLRNQKTGNILTAHSTDAISSRVTTEESILIPKMPSNVIMIVRESSLVLEEQRIEFSSVKTKCLSQQPR